MAQIAELSTGHENQLAVFGKRRKDLTRKFPLMILDHVVFLGCEHM